MNDIAHCSAILRLQRYRDSGYKHVELLLVSVHNEGDMTTRQQVMVSLRRHGGERARRSVMMMMMMMMMEVAEKVQIQSLYASVTPIRPTDCSSSTSVL